MHEVFISYSSSDKRIADAACAMLEARHIRCWIAPRDILPGSEWGAAIVSGLDSCKIMVLIFSARANASAQVRREVERAVSKGLTVLPCRIEEVRPEGALEYHLSNTHWLDAFTPPLERQLKRLAESVDVLLNNPENGARSTPPAGKRLKSADKLRSLPKTPALRVKMPLWGWLAGVAVVAALAVALVVFMTRTTQPQPELRSGAKELPKSDDPNSAPKPAQSLADRIREGRVKSPDLGNAKVLYGDDFTDHKRGWPILLRVGDDANGYRNRDAGSWPAPIPNFPGRGRYFIRRGEAGSKLVAGPWAGSDCVCEILGRSMGDPENLWGIEFNNDERERGVGIYLSGRGQLSLHPTYTKGMGRFPEPHAGNITHPAIKSGEDFNRLLVIARGRQVEVYVNGVAVCVPLTVNFDFFPAKLVLFMHARTKGEAEFERLAVYSAQGLPSLGPPK